jgi:hypothetical protein
MTGPRNFYLTLALLFGVTSTTAQGVLPNCAPNDTRTPVALWAPRLDDRGDLLSGPPPTGDGRIVYIEVAGDNDRQGCAAAPPDKLYSFSLPNKRGDSGAGGVAVNLRGNVQFANGYCYFSGFFMNEPVFGVHQGWTETYFGAVDKFKIIHSGRFCLATR